MDSAVRRREGELPPLPPARWLPPPVPAFVRRLRDAKADTVGGGGFFVTVRRGL